MKVLLDSSLGIFRKNDSLHHADIEKHYSHSKIIILSPISYAKAS